MKFSKWIEIKEQSAPAAPAPASATTSTVSTSSTFHNSSKGLVSSDIKPVPQRFGGSKQTSDCHNCSKDFWKNWYYTKKNRKNNK